MKTKDKQRRYVVLGLVAVAVPLFVLACGDDKTKAGPNTNPTANPTNTTPNPTTNPTTTGTTPIDAGPDAPAKRTGCLDRPQGVDRPDRLPCELIPPGVTLP